jgi:phosphatidate phosphatase LPIN
MAPDSLMHAFKREVIDRRPQEFKIGALSEVKSLFPSLYQPFYAGFGNRDTDDLSYRAVGVHPQKIFIINPASEVSQVQHNHMYRKSYVFCSCGPFFVYGS